MSDLRAIRVLSLWITACLGFAAVAACTIPLRGGEEKAGTAASVPAQADPAGAKLRECRSVVPEQEDLLRECRKIWVERRRLFLKDRNDPAPETSSTNERGQPSSIFPLAPSRGR
jgi:conjugative transfer region protein TrbK